MKVRQFFQKDQYLFGLLGGVLDVFFATVSVRFFDLNGYYVTIILAIPTGFLIILLGMRTAEEKRPHIDAPRMNLKDISLFKLGERPQIKIGEDKHNCPVHGLEFCANARSNEHCCMETGMQWKD